MDPKKDEVPAPTSLFFRSPPVLILTSPLLWSMHQQPVTGQWTRGHPTRHAQNFFRFSTTDHVPACLAHPVDGKEINKRVAEGIRQSQAVRNYPRQVPRIRKPSNMHLYETTVDHKRKPADHEHDDHNDEHLQHLLPADFESLFGLICLYSVVSEPNHPDDSGIHVKNGRQRHHEGKYCDHQQKCQAGSGVVRNCRTVTVREVADSNLNDFHEEKRWYEKSERENPGDRHHPLGPADSGRMVQRCNYGDVAVDGNHRQEGDWNCGREELWDRVKRN